MSRHFSIRESEILFESARIIRMVEEAQSRRAASEQWVETFAAIRKAEQIGRTVVPAENYRELKGRGAQGSIGGRTFWIGSHRFWSS